MLSNLLLAFLSVNTFLYYGGCSYSAISDYHRKTSRMASIKASFVSRNIGVPPSSGLPMSSRVHHAVEYGADPTGKLDSTDALQQAISDAFQSPLEGYLIQGVANLGGAQLHLDGGTYKISRPLRLPKTSSGNFMVLPTLGHFHK